MSEASLWDLNGHIRFLFCEYHVFSSIEKINLLLFFLKHWKLLQNGTAQISEPSIENMKHFQPIHWLYSYCFTLADTVSLIKYRKYGNLRHLILAL